MDFNRGDIVTYIGESFEEVHCGDAFIVREVRDDEVVIQATHDASIRFACPLEFVEAA